jgi:hypothetical protein
MWFVTLLGGVRATLFAALALAFFAAFGVDHYRLAHAQATAEVCQANERVAEANISTLTASNASKDAAVKDLQQQLDRLTGLKQEIEKARDAAVTAQATAAKARDKALADLHAARRQIYAQDSVARLWAVAPVPRTLTVQLRDAWAAAGGSDDGSGRGSTTPAIRGDSRGATRSGDSGTVTATGVHDSDCTAGCYSDDQLFGAATVALNALERCNGKLSSIAILSATAVASNARASR